MKAAFLAESILVGRQRELKELESNLDAAIRGQGNAIFISGEAGSGKTRLASEFLNIARKKEITVLSGWCLSNVAVPYFPFLEALESFSAGCEGAKTFGSQQLKMKTWLTESNWAEGREKQYASSPRSWRDQAFAAVTRELLLMSSSKPTILFIDDIHWADSASLSLLHYIARAINSERILLLATFRSEEIAANVEGQPSPLLEALRLMGREGVFKEISLKSLNQVEVGKIAESMLGGSVHMELVERLATESRGVPLFVVESLRMLHEQGSFIQEHGQWRLNVEKYGIPDKVKDVILRRLDSLKPSQRRILDAASAVGEKFDPKLLAEVLSQDNLDVLESLNMIAESTLLVNCQGDYYGFVHAKFREMLYHQIPSPLKKEYHSRIAEKLESSKQSLKQFPVSDLAYHFAQAGNKEKSVKYALAAGKDDLARFSNKEALKHFTHVLQFVSEDSEYTNEKAIALEGLGEAFFGNSMFKEATRTFEQLSDITTDVVKLRALRRAMDSAFFQGEFAHLLELTKKAEALATVDRLESARVLMNRARAVMFLGNPEAGTKDFEAALQVFEEEYSLPDVARTLLGLGGARSKTKEKGLANQLLAVALYEELGDARGIMDACNRAGQIFGFAMLTKESLEMHTKAIEIGEKIGDYNRLAEACASLGWVLENADELAEALSRSLKALEYCEKTDSDWVRGMTYSNLARQYGKLGDSKLAEEYFEKLQKLPPQVLKSYGFVRFGLSRAVFLAVKSGWTEANQYFGACLKSPAVVAEWFEIETRKGFAWALNKQGRVEEARKQLEAAEKVIKKLGKSFQHANIQATMMAPREAKIGKEFTIRIDIINVSRKSYILNSIEKLFPSGIRVNALPSYCSIQANSVKMHEKRLDPFKVEPVITSLQATRTGSFCFEPRVVFVDDLEQTQTLEIRPVRVTVQPTTSATKLESIEETAPAKLEFKSEAAQKAFDYLVSAFVEDYRRLKLPQERAGWRTLNQVAKHAKISKYSVYGSSGSRGQAISELERCGIVEARAFTGERGRGGKILKIRVAYERSREKTD